MKKFLLSLAAISLGVVANAGPVVFDFAAVEGSENLYGLMPVYDGTNNSPYLGTDTNVATQEGITITFNGEAENSWRLWTGGIRAYNRTPSPTFTVASINGADITGIELTLGSQASFSVEGEEGNVTSWTGNANSVTFTYTGSGNKDLQKVTVYTGGETPNVPTVPEAPTGVISVAEALEYILAGGEDQITVKGVVTKVTNFNANYGSITYYIADEGVDNELQVYGGLGLNGEKFTSQSDVVAGAKVEVQGKVKLYNSTPEFDSNSILLSYEAPANAPVVPTFPETTMTVSQALALMAEGATGQATVKGIITRIQEISTSYGNATYFIGDTADAEETLEVYRGYSLNGEKFTSENEIAVGGTVTVSGSLVNYNGTLEFTTGSKILEYTAPEGTEPEPVVTRINEVTNGVTLEVTATVMAQSSRGLILANETGAILYYNNNVDLTTYPIGTVVDVKGVVSVHETGYQLTNTATLTVTGSTEVTYPTPMECDATTAEQILADKNVYIASYITGVGTLVITGNYYNINIPGFENGQGSLLTPAPALAESLVDGKTYQFTGYYLYVSSGKYLNMMLVKAEEVASDEPGQEPEPTPEFTGKSVTFDFTDPTSLKATLDGQSIDFNDDDATEYDLAGVTIYNDIISINSTASEEASTMPRLYLGSGNNAGWTYRFYKNNTITISAHDGYKIEGIVFEATNLGNASVLFTGNGQFKNNVWTAYENSNVTEVVITKSESGNNPTISTMTVYYLDDPTNGVNEIANDLNAPVEYFNLQGQKVLNPSNGIFIIRQGNKTSKVVIR